MRMPKYAAALSAANRACAGALASIVRSLPIPKGARVLDLACGDGIYLPWLAERSTEVVAMDANDAYLDRARAHVAESGISADTMQFVRGDAMALPFEPESFDTVWCAHSLYSLTEPDAVLRGIHRVLRPDGVVAVLENDSMHRFLLPWPPELEARLLQAQIVALEKVPGDASRFYIGRWLRERLRNAGFAGCRLASVSIDHSAPLDPDEVTFLVGHLRELRSAVAPELDVATLASLDRAIGAAATDEHARAEDVPLLAGNDFFATHLELVATARKE